MSTTRDRERSDGGAVSLTMAELWRLAAGESVTVHVADGSGVTAVELDPPDPFDGTLPADGPSLRSP